MATKSFMDGAEDGFDLGVQAEIYSLGQGRYRFAPSTHGYCSARMLLSNGLHDELTEEITLLLDELVLLHGARRLLSGTPSLFHHSNPLSAPRIGAIKR